MSSMPPLPDDHEAIAAEYALGLLEGEELAQAEALERGNAAFRAAVARWNGSFAPMFEDVAPVEPPPGTFDSIERRLDASRAPSNDNVIGLRRRLNRWRAFAGGATALAASLAMAMVMRPPAEIAPPAARAAAPMVAMIEGGQGAARIVATWSERDRSLMVVPAAVPAADAGHAHELWMIPADGKPRSMGVMPDGPMHVTVDPGMADKLAEGVVLAVSLEPAGGSPTGAPTGPVLASGKLQRA